MVSPTAKLVRRVLLSNPGLFMSLPWNADAVNGGTG